MRRIPALIYCFHLIFLIRATTGLGSESNFDYKSNASYQIWGCPRSQAHSLPGERHGTKFLDIPLEDPGKNLEHCRYENISNT